MKKLINTLYITRQESYLHKERETIVIKHGKEKLAQFPALTIGNILCFGQVSVSPFLMGYCGEQGIGLAFYTEYGKFLARVQGKQSGNVLLRRPPTDPVNALLSFAYTLITHECSSALQGVGLDPYVGFLHKDRPGRMSLALDLLEEFRAPWADRFVLTLINRQQIKLNDFVTEASGAVRLTDDARKVLLTAWQERKQVEIIHPYLQESVPIGLLPHCQAMLLARHLRGDTEYYPPYYLR